LTGAGASEAVGSTSVEFRGEAIDNRGDLFWPSGGGACGFLVEPFGRPRPLFLKASSSARDCAGGGGALSSLNFLGRPRPLFTGGASTPDSTGRAPLGQSRLFSGSGTTTSGSVGGAFLGEERLPFRGGTANIG
jgi:hypothetical protein